MRLDGRIALITGAARGQGAAAARRFVEEGARVMLTDVLDDQGKELAAELGAEYCHLDVSNEDEWAEAVAFTISTFGDITVLVNNAGVLHFSALADTTLAGDGDGAHEFDGFLTRGISKGSSPACL